MVSFERMSRIYEKDILGKKKESRISTTQQVTRLLLHFYSQTRLDYARARRQILRSHGSSPNQQR